MWLIIGGSMVLAVLLHFAIDWFAVDGEQYPD
jgi:hypothetical protein